MDTHSFNVHVKTGDIYEDIAKDKRFDTSNYELERPLLKEKNKNVIRLMKVELVGKIMKEFARLRVETCTYLTDDNNESKTAKGINNV